MNANLRDELLAKLKGHHDAAEKEGLVVRFRGFGVLVLCLPEYGTEERHLTLPLEDREKGRRSGDGQSKGSDLGASAPGSAGEME